MTERDDHRPPPRPRRGLPRAARSGRPGRLRACPLVDPRLHTRHQRAQGHGRLRVTRSGSSATRARASRLCAELPRAGRAALGVRTRAEALGLVEHARGQESDPPPPAAVRGSSRPHPLQPLAHPRHRAMQSALHRAEAHVEGRARSPRARAPGSAAARRPRAAARAARAARSRRARRSRGPWIRRSGEGSSTASGRGSACGVVERLLRRPPSPATPVDVDRLVHRDAREPGRDLRRPVPPRRVHEGLHERLLDGVEGVIGLPEIGEGDPVEPPVVPLHQGSKGLAVARGQPAHQVPVGRLAHGRAIGPWRHLSPQPDEDLAPVVLGRGQTSPVHHTSACHVWLTLDPPPEVPPSARL